MPLIIIETEIFTTKNIAFDLARSIDLHKVSTAKTNEEAISGTISGLINLGESVTWKAKHIGFTQNLTTKITEFKYPEYFVDEMTKGIFKSFKHEHIFKDQKGNTLMIDKFEYKSPFGFLGKIVDLIFLKKYMTKFLIERNEVIKEFAETEKWKQVLLP
jgi:ligand-binding SRPBCC domain-containing protein